MDREEDDCVPVRDINSHSTATDAHAGVTETHTPSCRGNPVQAGEVSPDTHTGEERSAEILKTAQCLLGELKALIAVQGSLSVSGQ